MLYNHQKLYILFKGGTKFSMVVHDSIVYLKKVLYFLWSKIEAC